MTKSLTSRAFSGHCKISRSPVDSSIEHHELWQLTHSDEAARDEAGGNRKCFNFCVTRRRCDAGMPVSVPAPCMQTISTIASTKFLVILLHISEDRLVVVVVTHGVTGTRTQDTGHRQLRVSSVSCLICLVTSRFTDTRDADTSSWGAMRCSLSGCGSAFNVYVTPSVCLLGTRYYQYHWDHDQRLADGLNCSAMRIRKWPVHILNKMRN